ncbi:MAG: alpha/beta hydrolase [Acidimicrobiales bacterium]|nr:alpha/beta hydrolase [Acidimicrobiales bacterium]
MTPTASFVSLPSGVALHTLHWQPPNHTEPRTPWVLTHGLASNARLWDGAARRLAHHGHPVVTVDQRGHGQSSKPEIGYDVATCADDLAFLISELGLKNPAVAGQSWGGNVVLELAHRHPELVAQICCVDGGFIDLQSQFPTWEECEISLAPPALLGTPAAEVEAWIARSTADWPEEGRAGTLSNFEIQPDGTIAPLLTFDRHMAVLRGLWEHRPFEIFGAIEVPALLIAAGEHNDPRTEDRERTIARALSLLPTGRAEWFIPAHHDVHAQHPAAVADLLHRAVTRPGFYHRPSATPEAPK